MSETATKDIVSEGEIVEHETHQVAERQSRQLATTPARLLEIAVQKGTDLDQLQKLMELQERWEANEAKKAYVSAMSAFKKDPPELFKNKLVSYTTRGGDTTEYRHATLDHIANQVSAHMAPHGLSFRWDTDQENGRITVACVVTHELGHSERTTLYAEPDSSGGKNSIQAIGSTVSYLQRYTLLAATGLATQGMDDDGRAAGVPERASAEQLQRLRETAAKVKRNEAKVCEWLRVETLEDLTSDACEKAIISLEQFA